MKKFIVIALLLSSCCRDNDADCTTQELVDKKADKQREITPEFVSERDGVRVYRLWTREPYATDHWTYFTTPCGDVSAEIEYHIGKTHRQIPSNVNGTGCQQVKDAESN